MALKTMEIGKRVNYSILFSSLLFIFIGAVISSKFDSWYAIGGGATLAVLGSFLNTLAVSWVRDKS